MYFSIFVIVWCCLGPRPSQSLTPHIRFVQNLFWVTLYAVTKIWTPKWMATWSPLSVLDT